MATAPNFGAETLDKLPMKLPMGVRAADTITTLLFILKYLCVEDANLIIFNEMVKYILSIMLSKRF
jgi:hypothetical protein